MCLDHKKIDKNNQAFVDLRTKCVSEPDTSQETKRQNINSIPVIHTAVGQVNIVTIKGRLVQENILEALMEMQNTILIILLPSLSYIFSRKKFLSLYKNTSVPAHPVDWNISTESCSTDVECSG